MKHPIAKLTIALISGLFITGCFPPANSNLNLNSNVNANSNANQPPPPPATVVKITAPGDGDKVDQTYTVRGTSQKVLDGQKIWVVIFVDRVGRYFPQNNPADVQADGNWDSVAYFGIPSNVGWKFDILAVTADKDVQDAFSRYLKEAKDKNDYPGLEQLPKGATIQHRISVIRK